MRYPRMILATAFCLGGLLACVSEQTPESGQSTTLRFEHEQGSGDLKLCDENGDCSNVSEPTIIPNPRQCEVYTVEISSSGRTCERCEDASGTVLHESCDEADIACTLVTAPEPDCVVCAHIGGTVVYSSCIPEEPLNCETLSLPSADGTASDPNGSSSPTCQMCYDSSGRLVVDECSNSDCQNIVCPQVLCAPGFEAQRLPGSCCETCVPVDDCREKVCPFDVAIPDCPEGTQLTRDPADCCGVLCQPLDCSNILCPAYELVCPPGFHPDFEFPNCCGTCVPDEDMRRYCFSDLECGSDEFCTAGIECLPPPPDASSPTGGYDRHLHRHLQAHRPHLP